MIATVVVTRTVEVGGVMMVIFILFKPITFDMYANIINILRIQGFYMIIALAP